jgi:hypothetical protein
MGGPGGPVSRKAVHYGAAIGNDGLSGGEYVAVEKQLRGLSRMELKLWRGS